MLLGPEQMMLTTRMSEWSHDIDTPWEGSVWHWIVFVELWEVGVPTSWKIAWQSIAQWKSGTTMGESRNDGWLEFRTMAA